MARPSHRLAREMVRPAICLLALALWPASAAAGRSLVAATARKPVPLVRQQTEYSCGAASLRAVLKQRGQRTSEAKLRRLLHTSPAYGTHPEDLLAVAPRFKLRAAARERTTLPFLARALAAGKDVIINMQAWPDPPIRSRKGWRKNWKDGHWVVLQSVGPDGSVVLMDPYVPRKRPSSRQDATAWRAGRIELSRPDFLARWHDHFVEKGPDRRYLDPPRRRRYQHLAIILEPAAAPAP